MNCYKDPMKPKGRMEIKLGMNEHDLMENLLNMRYSGVDEHYIFLVLSLAALSEAWHINKLTYYINLLGLKT